MSTTTIPTTNADKTSPYHTSPTTIVTALRALADRFETVGDDVQLAQVWLSIDLQVSSGGDASQELRAATVDALTAVLDRKPYYDNDCGHYRAARADSDRAAVVIYGKMRPTGAVLDALIDEAYAESQQRLDDRKARLDQIDEWMLRHAGHGHPIRDPQGEYRVACDWMLAIDAHQAIGGKLPERIPGATLVDNPAPGDEDSVAARVVRGEIEWTPGNAPTGDEITEEIVLPTTTDARVGQPIDLGPAATEEIDPAYSTSAVCR